MGKKIQIEQLPATVTEDQIRELFKPFGAVKNIKFEASRSDASHMSSVVDMEDNDGAHKAIEKLNGAKFKGNLLLVHKAHAKDHFDKNASGSSFSNKAVSGGSAFRAIRGGSNRGR